MAISLTLHIVGITLWFGGLIILSSMMRRVKSMSTEAGSELSAVFSRALRAFVFGGCVLTVCTGLFQLVHGGVGMYFSQGWFHSKLTLAIVAVVITVMLSLEIKRLSDRSRAGRLLILHAASGAILIAAVGLTIFHRLFV
ncbi:MAG: hypothetical protein K1X83_04325 [Oligoflexia bacterium]|nr:hypothetical protein [Oligoflexia bacterium]